MSSPHVPLLKRKIAELEDRQAMNPSNRLSVANKKALVMYRLLVEFDGKDQVIVVQKIGANPDGSVQGPVVKPVNAATAASMLAAPDSGQLRCRLATPAEITADREYNLALTARAKQRISDDAMKAATARLHSALGLPPAGIQDPSKPEPKPPTPAPVEEAAKGADIPAVVPDEDAPTTPLSEDVLAMLKDDQAEALAEAGFDTMEKLVAADPKAVANAVDGVGPSTAAKLIAEAAVGLSDEEPDGEPTADDEAKTDPV